MQRLIGGMGNDRFVFNGAGFNGSIDGGISGTDILDFRRFGSPVTVAVTGAGAYHGVQGGATGLSGGFNDIDSFRGATVIPADLSISGNATPTVAPGGQIVYHLTVTSIGSSAQNNVTLTDHLPAHTTFVSWTAPNGWSSSTPAVGRSGTVSASIASLPAGVSANFTLVVQVKTHTADGTIVSNTASVHYFTANLSTTFDTTVVPPVNVSADVSVTRSRFRYDFVHHEFVQTITITNTSNSTLYGQLALLLTNLPHNAVLVNASGKDANGDPYINFVSPTGQLAADQSITVTLYFKDPTFKPITYGTQVLEGL